MPVRLGLASKLLSAGHMALERRLRVRIAKEFAETDRVAALSLLEGYAGREPDRVRWDILELSKGNLEKVREYLEAARIDYRDVLYWAEYFQTDPMLKERDPKQLVDEVLEKFGD